MISFELNNSDEFNLSNSEIIEKISNDSDQFAEINDKDFLINVKSLKYYENEIQNNNGRYLINSEASFVCDSC